jgi:hypothetical protein
LKEQGVRLPKSTRTIHRLVRENGRIASRLPRLTEPIERSKPMEQWQLDFKDASTVPGFSPRQKTAGRGNTGVSSTKVPRSWSHTMCAPILLQKPLSLRSPKRRLHMAYLLA